MHGIEFYFNGKMTEIIIPTTSESMFTAVIVIFGIIFIGGIVYSFYQLFINR